jgi:IclR family acetate operon transcriptional repressor
MSSIRRSVQVMDLLSRRGPLGVRAVAQQLSLPLGSVHRILIDLAAEAIVERTPDGEWELSYRLLTITGLQLDRLEFSRLARPYCERIAEATRETVNVSALSGGTGVCIDKVRGNEGMQLDARIGSRGPLYCGGSGKAMLAYISPDEQQRILDSPLAPLTPNTITDPSELKREIARIRRRGYSIDNEEVVLGVHCVGMPILDRSGWAVGGISITGPAPKVPGPALDGLVAKLNEVCGHVSRRLGYSGTWPPVEGPDAEPRAATGPSGATPDKTRRVRRPVSA